MQTMRKLLWLFAPHSAATTAMAILFALAPAGSASAYAFKNLHSFCKGQTCGDGADPWGSLLIDQSGSLYGTTIAGGKYQAGLVFKLIPNGDGTYKEYVLHNFCARANCADGQGPFAGLIMDIDGNLYGTTQNGGKHGSGVVFKLTHKMAGWSLSVIHSFCSGSSCAGGSYPRTGLTYSGQASGAPWNEFSPLFGTTQYGGTNGQGVAYKLAADGGLWDYEVIHSFKAVAGADTALPSLPLVDSSGNILGLTASGGKFGYGVLYKLAAGSWKETTLHNFCDPAIGCADGASGYGQLAMDAAGNLFGTTWYSDCGQHSCDFGIVFERTAGGTYSVIDHICGGIGCPEGEFPLGLIIDASGNLFGTTEEGGTDDAGTAFQLSYDSGQQQWIETTLYKFCSEEPDCTDGKTPEGPPILDSAGNLFGTTSGGGAGANGAVFELTP